MEENVPNARYDEEGNIVLPESTLPSSHSRIFKETTNQLAATLCGGSKLLKGIGQSLRTGGKDLWVFLCQPVWVPGPRREPRKYSRIALFFLDTIRFGGTFASIFVVLFALLNYQSFWDILSSHLDPLAQLKVKAELQAAMGSPLIDKLKQVPSLPTAGRIRGDLLSYLPHVGPPDKHLIVPRLGINVPIAIPPQEALIAENWAQLEKDIQDALEEGVVHYPGTARPGQAGNFFITGHSSYYPWAPGKYKTIFARLPQLTVGDEYWVYYNGDRHRYIIQEKKEVRPSDVSILDQPLDRRIGTLMTCTPVGTTLKRFVLMAQEVDPETGLAIEVGDHKTREELPRLNVETLPI